MFSTDKLKTLTRSLTSQVFHGFYEYTSCVESVRILYNVLKIHIAVFGIMSQKIWGLLLRCVRKSSVRHITLVPRIPSWRRKIEHR